MKQREIKKCLLCGEGIMHCNSVVFYRVKIEEMVVDLNAIKRQTGLEQMLGNARLASIMGTDENIANPVSEPISGLLCFACADNNFLEIHERATNGENL